MAEDATDGDEPLPESVLDAAERLTRLAREATADDETAAYREERDSRLADHGYRARLREDDDGDVLVCYPSDWIEDGVVQVGEIDDLSRGAEVAISGPGDPEDWTAVDAHNRAVAKAVAERHGDPHAATAAALADFASNHYAKRIEDLTAEERREFREDYLPRNAWPSDAQRERAADSVRLTVDEATDGSDPGVAGPEGADTA